MKAVQLKMAATALAEVDAVLVGRSAQRLEDRTAARDGLARGSRLETWMAEHNSNTDQARVELRKRLAEERRAALLAATEAHRESRMEARRINGLMVRIRLAEELERQRRSQAESDDRFLSRREWLRIQDNPGHQST